MLFVDSDSSRVHSTGELVGELGLELTQSLRSRYFDTAQELHQLIVHL